MQEITPCQSLAIKDFHIQILSDENPNLNLKRLSKLKVDVMSINGKSFYVILNLEKLFKEILINARTNAFISQ